MPENTGSKQALTQWKPGQSGNPAGKPKGAKHRLQEDFVKDVQAAWEEKGKEAITMMIADKPGDFVKMVASLMPKDITLNINDNSEMTDDELTSRIRDLAAQLSPFLLNGTGDAATGTNDAAGSEQPSIVH
jgi:hypothetical protein